MSDSICSSLVSVPPARSPAGRERQCHGTATLFAVLASMLMIPAVLATPGLLVVLAPIGLLWLCTVVGPGLTLGVRYFKYVLGYPLPGGSKRLWTQTAALSGGLGAAGMYLTAAVGGGLMAVVPLILCVLAGVALVARDKDRGAA